MSHVNLIRVQACADELLGSATTITEVLTAAEQDNQKFLEALDERVMQCDACGWWVEADDVNGDNVCSECAELDD